MKSHSKGLPCQSSGWTANAGGDGSIPGQAAGLTATGSVPRHQNIKEKQQGNKFNKDFKNSPHQKKKRNLKSQVTKAGQ